VNIAFLRILFSIGWCEKKSAGLFQAYTIKINRFQ